MQTAVPVILAGGVGSRLWPVSTPDRPKQFLIETPAGLTLFQAAIMRVSDRKSFEPPVILCAHSHLRLVHQQLMQIGCEDARIVLEPEGRGTAPAIALAAHVAMQTWGDCVLAVLPSDHAIENLAAWRAAMEQAINAARGGCICLLGATPTEASVEYGYIHLADGRIEPGVVQQVEAFVEKPDANTARAYIDAGDYVWNCGMFVMQARTACEEFERAAADIWQATGVALGNIRCKQKTIRPDARIWSSCPRQSFDYAVLQSSARAAVIPVEMGWSDLGTWGALHRYAMSARQVSEAGEHPSLVRHAGVAEGLRPWGWFEQVDEGDGYRVKKLFIDEHAKISLQSHRHRSEHWVVVRGTALVTCNDRQFTLRANESTYIAAGDKHRLENVGVGQLVIIEIQAGALLSEQDITRYEDAYMRI